MPKLALKPGEYRWIDRGIFARGTAQGIVYGISYQHRGRRRLEVVGPTITLARKALAVRKAEIAQGKYQLPAARRIPRFPAFMASYLADYSRPNKRSFRRDEQTARHLLAFFGDRHLDEITGWDVERYRAARIAAGAAIATVNLELALLRHAMGFAQKRGLVVTNPVRGVKPGRVVEKPFRILSAAEEWSLLQHVPPDFWPVVVLALHTGLRRGELAALEWRDVDLPRRQLTVRQSKSGRVRVVPLNPDALDALKRVRGEGRVFGLGDRDASRWNRQLSGAARAAGIPALRFHDLRHTFASRLVMAGVDLPTVQELLGHASILMTRRYAHPTPEHRREAVSRLSGTAAKVQRLPVVDPDEDRRS